MFCNNFYSSSTFAFISDLFFFCSSFVDFCRRMILIEKVSRVIRKGRTNGFFFLYRQRVRMFYNNFYPSPSFVFLSVLFSSALCSLSFIVGWFLLFLVKSFGWLVWAFRDNFFSFSILVFPFLFSSASLSFSRGCQLRIFFISYHPCFIRIISLIWFYSYPERVNRYFYTERSSCYLLSKFDKDEKGKTK